MIKEELLTVAETTDEKTGKKIGLPKAILLCWKELDTKTLEELELDFEQAKEIWRRAGNWHPARDFGLEIMFKTAEGAEQWREVFGRAPAYSKIADEAEREIKNFSSEVSNSTA